MKLARRWVWLIDVMGVVLLQAAEEFVVQARSTERRWSRALQYEHSLRLQLQENMEALAGQMQSLEDEASKSIQGKLPSRNKLLTVSNTLGCVADSSSLGKSAASTALSMETGPKSKSAGRNLPDEEDMFFDATDQPLETSPGPSLTSEGEARGHKRSISSTSVNDSQLIGKPEQLEESTDKGGPMISSDLRMAVSRTTG